jgi:hypothetical protein
VLLTFVATVSIALAEAVSSDSVVTKMNEESRLGADNVDIGWEPGTGSTFSIYRKKNLVLFIKLAKALLSLSQWVCTCIYTSVLRENISRPQSSELDLVARYQINMTPMKA